MNLLTVQNRINELMSKFVTQIKGATAMGRTDINRVSETILIPLFVELYGYNSILKFFQVDITGMFRMTSSARYFKDGVGSSRPNWR